MVRIRVKEGGLVTSIDIITELLGSNNTQPLYRTNQWDCPPRSGRVDTDPLRANAAVTANHRDHRDVHRKLRRRTALLCIQRIKVLKPFTRVSGSLFN